MSGEHSIVCPHGIDVSLHVTPDPLVDFTTNTIRYAFKQNVCLRCEAEAGRIVLWPAEGEEGKLYMSRGT